MICFGLSQLTGERYFLARAFRRTPTDAAYPTPVITEDISRGWRRYISYALALEDAFPVGLSMWMLIYLQAGISSALFCDMLRFLPVSSFLTCRLRDSLYDVRHTFLIAILLLRACRRDVSIELHATFFIGGSSRASFLHARNAQLIGLIFCRTRWLRFL